MLHRHPHSGRWARLGRRVRSSHRVRPGRRARLGCRARPYRWLVRVVGPDLIIRLVMIIKPVRVVVLVEVVW